MANLNNWLLIIVIVTSLGCGVKGRPLPPLNPAPIGSGEPVFKEPPNKKKQNKKLKENPEGEENTSLPAEE